MKPLQNCFLLMFRRNVCLIVFSEDGWIQYITDVLIIISIIICTSRAFRCTVWYFKSGIVCIQWQAIFPNTTTSNVFNSWSKENQSKTQIYISPLRESMHLHSLTIIAHFVWNIFRQFLHINSVSSLQLCRYQYEKNGLVGQLQEKACEHYIHHIYHPIFMNIGQNIVFK